MPEKLQCRRWVAPKRCAQVTETQAAQIEMDKTAEQFRGLHQDRKKLIAQWEEAVQNMQHRDKLLEQRAQKHAASTDRICSENAT